MGGGVGAGRELVLPNSRRGAEALQRALEGPSRPSRFCLAAG